MSAEPFKAASFTGPALQTDINTQHVTKTIMLLPRSGQYPLQIQDSYLPERKVSCGCLCEPNSNQGSCATDCNEHLQLPPIFACGLENRGISKSASHALGLLAISEDMTELLFPSLSSFGRKVHSKDIVSLRLNIFGSESS